MPDELRVALIGAAGRVAAPCHLHAWQTATRGRLVALSDVDREALDAVGDEWRIEGRYPDYRELLARPDIDAVDIVTPPYLHSEMTIAAAAAGKHVYVEKPMARSAGEARRMVDAARNAGVRLMVGESYVFTGSHMLARALIDAGEIGDVLQTAQTKGPWLMRPAEQRRLGGEGHYVPWRVDPVLSGGGPLPWLMDHAVHFFATARYLARDRPIAAVSTMRGEPFTAASRPRDEARPDDAFSVAWRYDGGGYGTWGRVDAPPEAVELLGFRTDVHGSRGTIRVFGEGGGAPGGRRQPPPVTLIRGSGSRSFELDDGEDRVWLSNVNYYDRAHANALQHFTDAVLDGTTPRYDGEAGLADVSATLAAIRSALEGRAIDVRSMPDDWTAYEG